MCIIVYKPVGIDLPDTLEDCWNNNNDGAGYCYFNGDRVILKKGFMNKKSLLDSLQYVEDIKNVPMLLHFRIATHGGVNKDFTHPFPLSNDLEKLTAQRLKVHTAICHNGIIDNFGSAEVSDTAEYIAEVVRPLIKLSNYRVNEKVEDVLKATLSGSRLAIMHDNEVSLIGKWYEYNGCYYSNENYKPAWSKHYYGKYYNDDWYYSDYSTPTISTTSAFSDYIPDEVYLIPPYITFTDGEKVWYPEENSLWYFDLDGCVYDDELDITDYWLCYDNGKYMDFDDIEGLSKTCGKL